MNEAKQKSNSTITTIVDGNQVLFTVLGAGSVTLDLDKVNKALHQAFMVHGAKQRISDRAAISRNPETGLSATPQDKLEAMRELVEHYHSGTSEWNLRTGSGRQDGGLLVQALMKAYPDKGLERVREYVKGLKADEKNALMVSPKLKAIVDELRAAATKSVDTEELLAGL
jgi:hypothetical protein